VADPDVSSRPFLAFRGRSGSAMRARVITQRSRLSVSQHGLREPGSLMRRVAITGPRPRFDRGRENP